MSEPTYKINIMDLADVKVSSAFLLFHQFGPDMYEVPSYMFLITGNDIPPIVVDTGVKEHSDTLTQQFPEMVGVTPPPCKERTVEWNLERFGYKPEDIKILLHTHLHVDHAGNDNMFTNAKIILRRREMMFAVAGIDKGYPPEYISYLVDQEAVPGKMKFFDDDFDLFPGIRLICGGGHTEGSTIISVNTTKGHVYLCGDIIYSIRYQTEKDPYGFPDTAAQYNSVADRFGERLSGNNVDAWGAKRYMEKIMREADIVIPSHDPDVLTTWGDTIE